MRKISVPVIIVIMLLPAALFAFNWQEKGFTVEDARKKFEETNMVLKGEKGEIIGVNYAGELSDQAGLSILKLNNSFRSWRYMKVERIDFTIVGSRIEILVQPSQFSYKGVNFIPSLPAGMIFIYTDHLSYNFRIIAGKMYLRMDGRFLNEEKFCIKFHEAVTNPITYLNKFSPKYMLKKMFRFEAELDKLREKMAAEKKLFAEENEKLRKKNQDLKNKYNDLKKKHETLLASHKKVQNAIMTLHNSGFLGIGNYEIKKEVVEKIIAMKKKDPKLTVDKAAEMLEKEKVEVSDDEIFLVFSVFFNDFKD